MITTHRKAQRAIVLEGGTLTFNHWAMSLKVRPDQPAQLLEVDTNFPADQVRMKFPNGTAAGCPATLEFGRAVVTGTLVASL